MNSMRLIIFLGVFLLSLSSTIFVLFDARRKWIHFGKKSLTDFLLMCGFMTVLVYSVFVLTQVIPEVLK